MPGYLMTSNRKKAASFSIGTGKRAELSNAQEGPSPNKYSLPSLAVEGPKMTMGIRNHKIMSKNVNPGPNAYNL